jgi:diguanylate cyclase (GGDEF)-like protein
VIAPNTAHVDAKILAERLRKRIETHNFSAGANVPESLEIKLTVSIGVSSYGGSITGQEILIYTADKNLYIAKEQGRNKVVADLADLADHSAQIYIGAQNSPGLMSKNISNSKLNY